MLAICEHISTHCLQSTYDIPRSHYIIISGSFLYVFSIFMLSLAQPDSYYQVFLTQAIGMGLGMGLLFLPALTVTAHHFSRKRALATGIVATGASVGGIVFPIMLNFLAVRYPFVFVIRLSGFLIAVLLLVANFLVTVPPSQREHRSPPQLSHIRDILTDNPYTSSIVGYVHSNL
jgi:MCP family monocarboxylic acid transporter-like MFS transporter 10